MAARLTSQGLQIQTLAEIISDLEAAMRADFGENIDLSDKGVLGQMIGTHAERESLLQELIEDVYLSQFLSSSTGVSVDRVLELASIRKNPEEKSAASLSLSGINGTPVPASSIARDTSGVDWLTSFAVTITAAGVSVDASPVDAGPTQALSGTITEIITPVVGWNSVTNPLDADVGRFAESDAEARIRYNDALSLDDVGLNILKLTSVSNVVVAENTTSATNADGLPPHSVEYIVTGGVDQDIADTIWFGRCDGIELFGSTSVNVTDIAGDTVVVLFTRPSELSAFVRIEYGATVDFPIDGETQMIQAILDVGVGIKPQEPLYSLRFIQAIETVGMSSLVAAIGTSASPTATLLTPSVREAIVLDSSRIEIVRL